MALKNNEIQFRSDEVQDIMSRIPNRIIRYGLSVLFVVLLLTIFLSWLITYPELIRGQISITTSIEPIKLIAKSSGTIRHLYVREGQYVQEGSCLAEIESPVSPGSLEYMRQYIYRLERALQADDEVLPLIDTNSVMFGPVQNSVSGLVQELTIYNTNRKYKIHEAEITTLSQKIENQKSLVRVQQTIASINQKELENAKIKYESDKKLAESAYISKIESMRSESELREKELQVERFKQAVLESSNVLSSLEFQYSQSRFAKETNNKRNIESIRSAIDIIHNFIFTWQQNYSIAAKQSGKVSFLQRIQQGQYIKSGEELFAVTQNNTSYLGIVKVPVSGYGKIAIGQKVHVLVHNFPYYEYGMLEGTVRHIALFHNSNEYRVEVDLPEGMRTTQNHTIHYSPEMIGEAEIVTENKRVIERIFESLLKALKRNH